jgi:hypothetical protein
MVDRVVEQRWTVTADYRRGEGVGEAFTRYLRDRGDFVQDEPA